MKPCREQKQLEFDEELLNCDSYDNLIYGRRLCQLNKITFTLNVVFRTCLSLPRTKTHPSLSATCTTASPVKGTLKIYTRSSKNIQAEIVLYGRRNGIFGDILK